MGTDLEIAGAFNYDPPPPWLFASDWDQAVIMCKNLLEHEEKIIAKQQEILNWWSQQIKSVKKQIEDHSINQ